MTTTYFLCFRALKNIHSLLHCPFSMCQKVVVLVTPPNTRSRVSALTISVTGRQYDWCITMACVIDLFLGLIWIFSHFLFLSQGLTNNQLMWPTPYNYGDQKWEVTVLSAIVLQFRGPGNPRSITNTKNWAEKRHYMPLLFPHPCLSGDHFHQVSVQRFP